MLIATFGGRIEVLGNYDGSDGLRIRDFPEMVIDAAAKKVTFQKVPTMVTVRRPLSKARHQYFSFLCEEGCIYLAQYLEQRMRNGEVLSPGSPIILSYKPWQKKKLVKVAFAIGLVPSIGILVVDAAVFASLELINHIHASTLATAIFLAHRN